MKAKVIVIGLAMSLAAGGAIASSWHWAKAPTREEAMRLATDKAQASAKRKGTCFKPAVRVDECQATANGFRCRADSATELQACGVRVGWVHEPPLAADPGPDGAPQRRLRAAVDPAVPLYELPIQSVDDLGAGSVSASDAGEALAFDLQRFSSAGNGTRVTCTSSLLAA
jgi:hypothetical protein